jgi:2,4-dienoyl-CoA reductase-like NADH-dependent reductase (Old Yellow Enzyme family)
MMSATDETGPDDGAVQVRKLRTRDELLGRLTALGVDLAVDAAVDPHGPLAQPLRLFGGRTAPNRFCVLPMEGWDGAPDGRPSPLVQRRWQRFGASGAGLVWAEATAVRPDGRANPNQLVIDGTTVDDLAALRRELVDAADGAATADGGGADTRPVVGLQLTHSGRWSRPDGSPRPRVAYRHPLLDGRVDVSDAEVLSDDELDELAATYVAAARLASEAGFDFVDVKHCHGYLAHELLTAVDRPGPYGGDLDGRTRFLRTVVDGIREVAPDLGIAVRLSAFDVAPHVAGADGRGVPEPGTGEGYRYAFGGDGTGVGVDLAEAHAFLDRCAEWGVGLVSVTAGSPYYAPHVQRPAWFPPSDGYRPPRDPLAEVARMVAATAELARAHPDLPVVASGLSYLQQWLPNAGQALVAAGDAAMVGYGRMALSYPDLPADVLAGRPLDTRRICRTLSDCTTAPRNGLVSGCYPYDPFYKALPEFRALAAAKQARRPSVTRAAVRSRRSP